MEPLVVGTMAMFEATAPSWEFSVETNGRAPPTRPQCQEAR